MRNLICINCNQELEEDTLFCPFCGRKVEHQILESITEDDSSKPEHNELSLEINSETSFKEISENQKKGSKLFNLTSTKKLLLTIYGIWIAFHLALLSLNYGLFAESLMPHIIENGQRSNFFTFKIFNDTPLFESYDGIPNYDLSEFLTYVLLLPLIFYLIVQIIRMYKRKTNI